MKKFFTAAPLQQNGDLEKYVYQAVDNEKLKMDMPGSFPILAAINGYVQPEEEFEIIAVMTDNERGKYNYQEFCRQTQELCQLKGFETPEMALISFEENQTVKTLADLFLNIIDHIQDGDQLYACMTFGTKPVSVALIMAMQFGYRARKNVTIDSVVYGEVVRPDGNRNNWFGRIYDQTGLLQLGETARLMAEAGVQNPAAAIRSFLAL